MPRIYYSDVPDLHIPKRSIFTHVFSQGFDAQLPAYIDAPTGKTLSRGGVRAQALQLAWGLKNILCQKRGDTMAIFSPNSITWPIVVLGGIAAGLRITTVNSAYTPREFEHQLHDSGAYYIFVHPALLGTANETLKLMKVPDAEAKKRIVLMGPVGAGMESWQRADDLLGKGQLEREEPFDGPAAHETVFLCYSSGTTSKSKGVELTHHNVISVICMLKTRVDYLHPDGPMLLSVLPFYHIYGLLNLLLDPFSRGAPQVVMSQFDPNSFCAYIERYKVTAACIVPPILVVLANHPAPEKYDLSSLQVLASGAAPLGEGLALAVHTRLRKLGADVMVTQGWGLTETNSAAIIQVQSEWKVKAGFVGRLLPNIQVRLVLDDGETDAAEGEPGEIWIKSPSVMKGYLNNPAATKDAITPDRWFKTGDVATVDKDGHFKVVDRKKELIKYKGFQVPPADLEGVLLTHPNVTDAGVIGVWSDAEATEYPRAYVVPRGGAASLKTTAEKEKFGRDVQNWVRNKVAPHKFLRGGVVIVDVIPKSAAGKILRRELRELAKKELQPGAMGVSKAKL
ncbi:AMP binding protein [Ramaria rubella]|nr:AMP binding protein [Ramaria rubella]